MLCFRIYAFLDRLIGFCVVGGFFSRLIVLLFELLCYLVLVYVFFV